MSGITWTRQTPALWTGRRDDQPAGTIERGTRYTYVDLDGGRSGGYRRLADARAAAERGLAPRRRAVRLVTLLVPIVVLLVCAAVAVGAVIVSRG